MNGSSGQPTEETSLNDDKAKTTKKDGSQEDQIKAAEIVADCSVSKPDKEQQQDTSKQTPNTGRRRRLAHRRQYGKSRQIASSFLKSQFVRYDILSSRYEAGENNNNVNNKLHGSGSANDDDADWYRIQNAFEDSEREDNLYCSLQLDNNLPQLEARNDYNNKNENIEEPCTSSTPSNWTKFDALSGSEDSQPTNHSQNFHRRHKHPSVMHFAQASSSLSSENLDRIRAQSVVLTPLKTGDLDKQQQQKTGASGQLPQRRPPARLPANVSGRKHHRLLDETSGSLTNYSSSDLDSYSLIEKCEPPATGAGSTNGRAVASSERSTPVASPTTTRSFSSLHHQTRSSEQQLNSVRFTRQQPLHKDQLRNSLESNERLVVRSETLELQNHLRGSAVAFRVLGHPNQRFSADDVPKSDSFFKRSPSSQSSCWSPTTRLNHQQQQLSGRSYASSVELTTTTQSNLIVSDQQIQAKKPNATHHRSSTKSSKECIDNVHFNDLFHGSVNDSSSVTINQTSVRNDPRLFNDDVDIKFSRALNSCKLPQIRYASKERLFERLTDLRFLSIDFLNTFLLTYRVFTTAEDVLEALKSVHYNCDRFFNDQQEKQHHQASGQNQLHQRSEHQNLNQRDSFSTFANSSLNSLNTNIQTTDHQNVDEVNQPNPTSDSSSNMIAKSSPSIAPDKNHQQSLATTTTPVNQHKSSPPTVPPRSSGPTSTQADHHQQHQHNSTRLLLAPNSQQQSLHHKRRSTISALTPITGSNASSLANLTSTTCATVTTNQHLQPSSAGGKPISVPKKSHNSSSSTPHSNTTTISSECLLPKLVQEKSDEIKISKDEDEDDQYDEQQLELRRNSSFQLLFGSQNGSIVLQSPGAFSEVESDGSSLTSNSFNMIRARSSSMTNHNNNINSNLKSNQTKSPADSGVLEQKNSTTGFNLNVPCNRRVRANSLSQVTDVAQLHQRQQQQPQVPHWRLSYKKHEQEQAMAAAAAKVNSNQITNTSTTNRKDYLTTGRVPSQQRRASSSDVNVTFNLRLDPPPSEQEQPDDQQFTLVPGYKPTSVPPSTPNETRSPASVSPAPSTTAESSSTTLDRRIKRQMSQKTLLLKEIELTEAKVLDCDTSADEDEDEDKISTSTSSGTGDDDEHLKGSSDEEYVVAEAMDDNDSSSEDDRKNVATKSTNEDLKTLNEDDDESFKILTRLNSVKSSGAVKNTRAPNDEHNSEKVAVENNSEHKVKVAANKPGLKSMVYQRDEEKNNTTINPSIKQSQHQKVPASSIKKNHENIEHQNKTIQHPPATISAPVAPSRPTSGQSATSGQPFIASPMPLASSRMTTPRSSFQHHATSDTSSMGGVGGVGGGVVGGVVTFGGGISKAGVIVTSSLPRISTRRSSTASAASAFAAATAASNNPILTQPPPILNKQHQQHHFNNQQSLHHQQHFPGGRKFSNVEHFSSSGGHSPAREINFATDLNNNQNINDHTTIQCSCSSFHPQSRGSVSSSSSHQQRPPSGRLSFQQPLQQQHYPPCIYYHQQSANSPVNQASSLYHQQNNHSEASSLCNSRTSSRLSSCAGLEYGSYNSSHGQVNFYAMHQNQQQQQHLLSQQQQQQHRGSSQHSPIRQHQTSTPTGGARFASGRIAPPGSKRNSNATQINVRSVATIRVLSVLRHWVSKHSQDFVNDTKLSFLVHEFLQDLIMDTNLLPAEHKAALQLQQMVQKSTHSRANQIDLDLLLAPPAKASPDSIETLSALEIAEGMTYLDHKIFLAIRSEEFLGQAWMKMDKAIKAPHILLITKRFNDVSRLVSSEIIRVPELHRRVAIIEKWTNVAHICRVVHNFNGVLQICAAFTNSAVFRLKKTWDKIPKTTKTTIDQLQSLVSTDSRFRNMRDAINRCDPPSIPYVGMYLTDLSFIEEGTPNYSPEGLLNFSKMRMIAHVIREIQHLQNGSYKIELNHKVANYLLDASRHLQDDEMYRCSLAIEPRSSGGKNGVQILNSASSSSATNHQQQQQLNNGSSSALQQVNTVATTTSSNL